MLTAQQLATMLSLQDKMNAKVNPDWLNAGYGYLRAAMVESVEAIEHHGWKWWKAQQKDLPQLQMELVDIWHFALSELLRKEDVDASIAEAINGVTPLSATTPEAQAEQFRLSIEALAASCLRTRSFELQPFLDAMAALPMAFEELFALYIGKNMLNRFRQNNGYKTGEYRKLWSGREDNEHLIELLEELNVPAAELPEALYDALVVRYSAS